MWHIIASLIVLTLFTQWLFSHSRRGPPLPPGPKQRLLTGNAHQMPRGRIWQTFDQLAKDAGSPIIYLRALTKRFIVANTYKAASDLLDNRAINYSERPRNTMLQEIADRKLAVFQIDAQHPRFKTYRRLLHSGLNARKVSQYQDLQARERNVLLRNLLDSPDQFYTHFRRNVGAITLHVAYGWTVEGPQDRVVVSMEQAIETALLLQLPGRWMVDIFPFLRFVPSWFPGASWKRFGEQWRQRLSDTDMFPHLWAKEQIASGNYNESFTSQHLLPDDGHTVDAEEESIIKWCTSAMYFAGTETTVSALETFVLHMVLYPEVQRRAREEIEAEFGQDRRYPRWDEAHKLPYVCAMLKEVLRISPPAVVAVPHRALDDDIYMGYRIPKDASVIANLRVMAHDPEVYPQPELFNPDRFLEKDGEAVQLDSRKFAFGFGRRICPGAQLSEAMLFVNMTGILLAFDIARALDEQGREIIPETLYSDTIISHPLPFGCRFVPRPGWHAGDRS